MMLPTIQAPHWVETKYYFTYLSSPSLPRTPTVRHMHTHYIITSCTLVATYLTYWRSVYQRGSHKTEFQNECPISQKVPHAVPVQVHFSLWSEPRFIAF